MGRARLIIILALGGGLAVAAPAPALAGSGLTAKASPHVVTFTHSTTIAGVLATHHGGVRLALEANPFPFSAGFTRVASTLTGPNGKYKFAQRPSLATRYRVIRSHGQDVQSKVTAAFVEPKPIDIRCNLCGQPPPLPGHHVLRVSYRLRYPRQAYLAELGKPVLLYYGQRNGSRRHPDHLALSGHFSQRRRPHHQTKVVVRHRVRFPAVFAWRFATCTQTGERTDGLGLPSAPGGRGCGDKRISYRQSLNWLG